MINPVCKMFDIEFPLLAFSHCRDVVAAVSKAGGMGVLGAASMTPEQLEIELNWIDEHIEGMSYGVDLIVPDNLLGEGETPDIEKLLAMVPNQHKEFVDELLTGYGIDASDIDDEARARYLWTAFNLSDEGAGELLEVAFSHPIKLIANALGVPPPYMLEIAKANNVVVAALVGSKKHAIKQLQAGVDVLIVSGMEGGGHCGSVTTMVLIPEVVQAIREYGDVPVLAAGGIVTGRQMAAVMAMGAAGAWTGSVWLTTTEAETPKAVKEKMLAASSSQTVRSKSRTGKFSRQLTSDWTDAWERPESPKPLPMPLQSIVTGPALEKVDKLADSGHVGARALSTYWVGQGVGMMNSTLSVKTVMQDFKEDFIEAYERLENFLA